MNLTASFTNMATAKKIKETTIIKKPKAQKKPRVSVVKEAKEPKKPVEKKDVAVKLISVQKEQPKLQKYFEAVGKRKSAVARVRLFTSGEKDFVVNGKTCLQYFQSPELEQIAQSSLQKMKCLDKFKTVILVRGGGIHAQAEAIRHGTARALIKFNQDFRKRLRRVGYITRDPRARERKKFGLKRARRAPQWTKR